VLFFNSLETLKAHLELGQDKPQTEGTVQNIKIQKSSEIKINYAKCIQMQGIQVPSQHWHA
jgi:hypothetical protein